MPDFFAILNQYIDYFPLVAFFGLLLAGLNLPVSEDLIIITGALLSYEKPSILVPSLISIFVGIIITDFFVYWIGGRARNGASKTVFFTKLVPQKALDKMYYYLDKYGIFTFIVCRFIPFGIRNTLFFTSGFFKLRFRIFIIYDIIAAFISMNTLFFLTYKFGDNARKPIKIAGIVLFIFVISALVSMIIHFTIIWRRKTLMEPPSASEHDTKGQDS